MECDSGLSISCEDVSALYLFNTRQFRFAYTFGLPYAKQPGFGTYDPGDSATEAVPADQIQMAFVFGTRALSRPTDSERGGPRGSVPVGLLHLDSGPEQTARTRRPSGQCPGRPTSSGLGPRADRLNAAALGAVFRSAYIIGTRASSRRRRRSLGGELARC